MLIHRVERIVGFTVALSIASPVADPDGLSNVGSVDVEPTSEPLLGRHVVNYNAAPDSDVELDLESLPVEAPAITPGLPGRIIDPWTSDVVETDIPVGPSNNVAQSTYLYRGRFTGVNPNWSCGDEPQLGYPDDPLAEDCIRATIQWRLYDWYHGRFGRQTQVYGSCVLAWVPTSPWNDRLGVQLQEGFSDVILSCLVGAGTGPVYVSNYAYASWPGNLYGTYSAYKSTAEPDGL